MGTETKEDGTFLKQSDGHTLKLPCTIRFHRRPQKSDGDIDLVMGLSNTRIVLIPVSSEARNATPADPKSADKQHRATKHKANEQKPLCLVNRVQITHRR